MWEKLQGTPMRLFPPPAPPGNQPTSPRRVGHHHTSSSHLACVGPSSVDNGLHLTLGHASTAMPMYLICFELVERRSCRSPLVGRVHVSHSEPSRTCRTLVRQQTLYLRSAGIWVFTVGVHSGYREKNIPPAGSQGTNQPLIGVWLRIPHIPLVGAVTNKNVGGPPRHLWCELCSI